MPHVIVLDDDQARTLATAKDAVELRDRRGNPLGTVPPRSRAESGFTEEEIAETRRRLASDEPRLTTRQVLDRLRSPESR